jgi:hypothetical protein
MCGFFVEREGEAGSVSGFIAPGEIQIEDDCFAVAVFAVVFIEDGFGDDVFFGGPVAEVAFAAAITAERKIFIHCGVGWRFAYWAFVFHCGLPGDVKFNFEAMGRREFCRDTVKEKFTPIRAGLRR